MPKVPQCYSTVREVPLTSPTLLEFIQKSFTATELRNFAARWPATDPLGPALPGEACSLDHLSHEFVNRAHQRGLLTRDLLDEWMKLRPMKATELGAVWISSELTREPTAEVLELVVHHTSQSSTSPPVALAAAAGRAPHASSDEEASTRSTKFVALLIWAIIASGWASASTWTAWRAHRLDKFASQVTSQPETVFACERNLRTLALVASGPESECTQLSEMASRVDTTCAELFGKQMRQ